MITVYALCGGIGFCGLALITALALGKAAAAGDRQLADLGDGDELMALADALQTDTPIHDEIAREFADGDELAVRRARRLVVWS